MRIFFLFVLMVQLPAFGQEECFLDKEHPMPVFGEETKKKHLANLDYALKTLFKDSTNADNIIWAGRRMAYLGNYEMAVNLFSLGIALHPTDARMYRHRGHRYITLRCFDKAIEDLEKAAALVEGKPDEVEPDGIPNEKNIPTSTLQSNIWYHLGLAYFLKGEYAKAEEGYTAGLAVSKNEDIYVAMANWLYITLLSQQKYEKAAAIYTTINQDAVLIENKDYLLLVYFYRHKPNINEIERYTDAVIYRTAGKPDSTSVSTATLLFGAGYYARLNGMPEKAKLFFEKAVASGQWSAFGYIAAEAMLNRIKYE